jgi:copper chaperone CopZ
VDGVDSVRTARHRTVNRVRAEGVPRVSPESEPVMPQLNLFVGGMSCRRCVREVTARLRDVPGVETVSANPGDCLVRLSGSMQLADVLTAFEGTSYRPDVQRDQDGNSGGTAIGQPPP